ncbi:putative glucose-repressible alcohol dehydrogenase transcriptional effector [Madurella mycetomatis]|uniref:Glucose-repressible alcohol dehydrogenase transcriptional effector n=1 Tax=Madurella mycetomatis TaxID=100816 RepID=A0A175VWA2_9PEZI|nr:putative glucose-repressible alcohol dehydrogenase transcriptional effector [Madurella mycetomatis]
MPRPPADPPLSAGWAPRLPRGRTSAWRATTGAEKGEYCPILYRTDVLRLLYTETKWLSPTPDSVLFGWGAGSRRVVTIGVFEVTGSWERFIHANTHLDNASALARTEGAKVVLERIRAVQEMWGPLGMVLTGDFNSSPGQDGYKVLVDSGYMEEVFSVADAEGKVVGTNRNTFTRFTGSGGSFIDFIWIGPKAEKPFAVQRYEILTNVVSGMYISDHRAVIGDVLLA